MIVAGFGFREDATVSALRDALAGTRHLDMHLEIEALAAPADKAGAACLQALAQEMALPVCPIQPDRLVAMETTTQSAQSRKNRGTGSVAEACALAAAGPQARLITKRHISPDKMATCAIAKGTRA